MLLSGAGFKGAFWIRSGRKNESADAPTMTMTAAAKARRGAPCAARLRRASLQPRRQLVCAGPGRRFQCEHRFKQRSQARRNVRCFELFDGKRIRLLGAVNLFHAMACKWRFPSEREPECFAQRVDVGAHVERRVFKLFRAGECRRADESVMGQRLRIGLSVNCLSQTEVDYFHQQLCIVGDVLPFRHRIAERASGLPVLNRGGLIRVFPPQPAPR